MRALRRWSVAHAGLVERGYRGFAALLRRAGPLARRIGPERLEKPVAAAERIVKGLMFDCHMCGRCVLSQNGMSCPMNCPKHVHNGPCGGVRADGSCEVDPTMRCVGLEGWRGTHRMAAGTLSPIPTAPAEHDRAGRSTWLPLMFADHAPAQMTLAAAVQSSGSALQALLERRVFVVTAEYAPPDSADPADVMARLEPFRGCVDALNVTDASGANCHISSLAVSVLIARAGGEPIMQMTCRDRNRIAIQGDLLGAAALGIRNVLCLTGDHVGSGDHPGAAHVGDLDAVTLLATARKMRDAGEYLSGRKLTAAPKLFLGAAANPYAVSTEMRVERLRRKVAAGAQFVQTQYCFDVDRLAEFMRRVRTEGLHERVAIIVGVGPIGSAKTARWLRTNVPGVHIPDGIIARLEGSADPREEGRRVAIELIRAIRDVPGVAGIHVMAHRQEKLVRSIVADSGVLAGRLPLLAAAPTHAA